MDPMDQRLAVFVEDHPLDYGSFEGIIPKGNYGAGTVMVWDHGTYVERGSEGREDSEKAALEGLAEGHITFVLSGQKLQGEFALIRFKKGDEKSWLLVKKRDEHAGHFDVTRENLSVKTGRSLKEIAENAESKGETWTSSRRIAAQPKERAAKPDKKRKKAEPAPISTEPLAEKLPRRLKPLMPAADLKAFDQEGWVFEPFHDGTRAIAEVESGKVTLHSRQLLSLNAKFPKVADALRKLRSYLVIDGEIVGDDQFHVFDLLHADGKSYRALPLSKRKEALKALPIFGDVIRYREHSETEGKKAYESAQQAAVPFLLAKDADSEYRSGTSKSWLKIKVKAPKASAVENGADKKKSEPAAPADQPVLTNLDKIYWPKEGYTKGDLVEYYRKIAPLILPHLKDRPQSLNRHPNGIDGQSFFQKDVIGHLPRFVETRTIFSESADKSINYLVCQNEATLLYMANLGCIELNPWISRIHSLENPDYLVIDLDPDDPNPFAQVVEVAHETHRVLNDIGALSFCKTSGSTGLHICVPLGARWEYDTVREFAEEIARVVQARMPDITSVERTPAKRKGKIYLDYLQNRHGQTLAAPYCLRPRPHAPVSTPVHWNELTESLDPREFTIETVHKLLSKRGDLWKPMLNASIDLDACRRELQILQS
jgi:bifunctional non-homologous end joining protein LigD